MAWRAGHLKEGVNRSGAEVLGEGICSPGATQHTSPELAAGNADAGAEGNIVWLGVAS